MRSTSFILQMLGLVAIAAASASDAPSFPPPLPPRYTLNSGRHEGKTYETQLTDAIITNTPAWFPVSSLPLLSASDAARIASTYLSSLPQTQIRYQLVAINLKRYFDTEWWFYVIVYECITPEWRKIEPYKTLIAKDQWDFNHAPRIEIVVLMTGKTVPLMIRTKN